MINEFFTQQAELFGPIDRTPRLPDDITANRHKNAPASVEANPAPVNKARDREEVFRIVRDLGTTHSKQIARMMDRPLNAISGRISELKASGAIEEMDERREGCSVLRVKR